MSTPAAATLSSIPNENSDPLQLDYLDPLQEARIIFGMDTLNNERNDDSDNGVPILSVGDSSSSSSMSGSYSSLNLDEAPQLDWEELFGYPPVANTPNAGQKLSSNDFLTQYDTAPTEAPTDVLEINEQWELPLVMPLDGQQQHQSAVDLFTEEALPQIAVAGSVQAQQPIAFTLDPFAQAAMPQLTMPEPMAAPQGAAFTPAPVTQAALSQLDTIFVRFMAAKRRFEAAEAVVPRTTKAKRKISDMARRNRNETNSSKEHMDTLQMKMQRGEISMVELAALMRDEHRTLLRRLTMEYERHAHHLECIARSHR